MKWTDSIRPGTLGMVALAAALSFAGQPRALSAQDSDCRCFDRDGNELENCSCFRTLRSGEGSFGAMFFERRSQIGVSISYDQAHDVETRGARIGEVTDGPAREAGLREGDIVVRVDGHSVLDPLEDDDREQALEVDQSIPVQRFVALVGALEPGEEVEFEILRDGNRRTIAITPERYNGFNLLSGPDGAFGLTLGNGGRALFNLRNGEMLEDMRRLEQEMGERSGTLWRRGDDEAGRVLEYRLRDGQWQGGDFTLGDGENGVLRLFGDRGNGSVAFGGDPCVVRRDTRESTIEVMVGWTGCTDGVEFTEMNEGLAGYFGTQNGVLVTKVLEGSALGLEAGDVVLALDGRNIDDKAELTRVLRSYDLDEEITLRIRRDNREMEVLGRRRSGGEG